jgi:hypothetical protein
LTCVNAAAAVADIGFATSAIARRRMLVMDDARDVAGPDGRASS